MNSKPPDKATVIYKTFDGKIIERSSTDRKIPVNKMRRVADSLVSKKKAEKANDRLLWSNIPSPNQAVPMPQSNTYFTLRSDDRNNPTGDFLSEVFSKEGKLLAEVSGAGENKVAVKLTEDAKNLNNLAKQELNSAISRAKIFVCSKIVTDEEFSSDGETSSSEEKGTK